MSGKLDERGLEAAAAAVHFASDEADAIELAEAAIRAYLQTAAADVSGLVERLHVDRKVSVSGNFVSITPLRGLRHEAASTLQTLSASNAALEAEIERLRGEMQRIIDAPLIDHSNPSNNAVAIARAALSAPKGGQDHG